MASETDPVLARIQAKIAAWQAAADSYRAALALESGELEGGSGHRNGGGSALELPVGAFRGMKIPEAIKLFLQAKRRKQTAREIAAGLLEGGMETTARNFETTVTGALHRMKDIEVLRFKDGWDLLEAHSTALRNRLAAKDTARPTKPKRASKGKKPAAAKAPKGPTLDERIVAFLTAHPMEWFTPKQVGDALKEQASLSLAFARLVRYDKIAKQDDGRYAAIRKG